ncbi:autotransporter outer membrane beta-barrel domain-containing protein [Mangrovicella endophytica]|uniref:autotransporter family protein n=1 Tax=Mangrovicella endophytica TaxID=2066697 RepID=UPI000C9EBC12|nr:autotransporter outer membrane beta-barrel domain-containing protein [Mangrovicella endophytica]
MPAAPQMRLRRACRVSVSVLALAAGLSLAEDAGAACSTSAPTDGETVICTPDGGADTTGVQGDGINDVTVRVVGPDGGIAPTFAQSAVVLGDRATIDAANNAPILGDGSDAIDVGDDATVTVGNILTSGKGAAAVRAGDRAAIFLREGGTITTTGSRADGINVDDDSSVTIAGSIVTEGPAGSGLGDQPSSGVIARNNASIWVTETGSIETYGTGSPGISTFRNAKILVDGSITTYGEPHTLGADTADGITFWQGSVVTVGESGHVAVYGAEASGIAAIGSADIYDTPMLADILIAGTVEAHGDYGHGVQVRASNGILAGGGPEEDPFVLVRVTETGTVSSELNAAIADLPVNIFTRAVDTTVSIAGAVLGPDADSLAIYLGAGDDTVILEPTYRLQGLIYADDYDDDGNSITPDDVDTFVLSGAADTEARFAFSLGDVEQTDGFERFRKIGFGRWTLDGDASSLAVSGEVENGILAVDAEMAGLDLTVFGGAVLTGTGLIGSLQADPFSIIAPGEGLERFDVAGDVTLSPDAALSISVAANGTHGLLAAGGAADINDAVLWVDGTADALARATGSAILTAEGGVTGAFAAVRDELPDLDVLPVYDGNAVLLGLGVSAEDGSFSDKSLYPETLSALLETGAAFSGTLRRQALNGLGGVPLAAGAGVSSGDGSGSSGGTYGYPDLRAPTDTTAVDLAPHAWMAGLHTNSEVDGGYDADVDGFATGLAITRGLAGGSLTLGLAAGYSKTDIDAGSGGTEAETGHVGLYAGWTDGLTSLSGALAYGRADLDSHRGVTADLTAEGSGDADLYAASFAASYNLAQQAGLAGNIVLAPEATLDLVGIHRSGFDETDAAILGLSAGSEDADRGFAGLNLVVGGRFETEHAALTPTLSVGYQRAFGDLDVTATSVIPIVDASFSTTAAGVAEDRFVAGAGLTVDVGETVSVTARYDGVFGSGTESQTGSALLSVRF